MQSHAPTNGGQRAETAFSRGHSELHRLLETLPAGAYTCDPDGLITFFNHHALELWGRAPQLNDPADRFCGSVRPFPADGTALAHAQCRVARGPRNGEGNNRREIPT